MRVYASVCLCVTQMAIQYAKKGVVGKGGGGEEQLVAEGGRT